MIPLYVIRTTLTVCFHDGFSCIGLCNYASDNTAHDETPKIALMPAG